MVRRLMIVAASAALSVTAFAQQSGGAGQRETVRQLTPLGAFFARLLAPGIAIIAHCVEHFAQQLHFAT